MFKKLKAVSAFSLVELMISLITVSLITAAFAPVITKKLSHGAITLGTFGGGSAEGKTCGDRYYFLNNECTICPAGYFCNGTNKIPCMAGTYARQGQTECTPCEDGYYSLDVAGECIENTALNCKEYSKEENACSSCIDSDSIIVDGNCVGSIPAYSYKNPTGADVTDSETEVTSDSNYWYIKIKSSGTLSFQTLPTNAVDVFLVGGGAGGGYSSGGCSKREGGGGTTITEKNVYVTTETSYPLVIAESKTTAACNQNTGNTTSGFGLYAHGGVYKSNHSTCAFGEKTCDIKYGELGTTSNQQANTGNGGASGKASMSGVIIIRGSKKNATYIKTSQIPSYRFMNTAGADGTSENSSLSVNSTYWYLKLTKPGTLSFDSLPSNLVDVFLVGGGAGGGYSSGGCSTRNAGGGNTVTERNVYLSTDTTYPIVIGASKGTVACAQNTGNTTSGFGLYAYGGVNKSDHSTCAFNEVSCEIKYGNVGSDTNQYHNTGNGGTTAKESMDGIIIIRGKLGATNSSLNIPSYTYVNTTGADSTNTNSMLNVQDSYWYLKLTASGKILFHTLPSDFIDVFLVGGGAGGGTSSSGCSTREGGGGNTLTERNVHISSGVSYPITVGASASTASCAQNTGNTTSGFGLYAYGGIYKGNHSTCAFNETSCEVKYGVLGTDNNQNNNTGNGGATAKGSMDGIVILRGKLKTTTNDVSNKLPIYTYTNSDNADMSLTNTILTTTDRYWYLKFTSSGNLKFEKLNSNTIDVFVVGGGAGGGYSSGGCSTRNGGGGNFSIGNNISVSTGQTYPIVVGEAVGTVACSQKAGNPSSAFDITAAGGSGATSHSVCLFNEADCTTTYGNAGSDTNQNNNTGNGGTTAKGSMSGVVIIRGSLL